MSAQCSAASQRPGVAFVLLASLLAAAPSAAERGLHVELQEPAPTYNREHEIVRTPKVSDKVPVVGKYVTDLDNMDLTYEILFAVLYIGLIASIPVMLAGMEPEGNKGWTAMIEVIALVIWLGGGLILLTHVIMFNSAHWTGARCLTVVETVYLFSQIITTVGYGDITPAYPRGQVVIGFYVLVSLLIIANMVSEVSGAFVAKIRWGVKAGARVVVRGAKKAKHMLVSSADDGEKKQKLKVPMESQRSEDLAVDYLKYRAGTPLTDRSTHELAELEKKPKVAIKLVEKPTVCWSTFFATGTVWLFFMFGGVCFYHFFPGENKTWLQAIYMSIVTLSTVGFGAFNATTEGGKVFGAFWMLFGVAALGGFVVSFAKVMLQLKNREKWDAEHVREQIKGNLANVTDNTRLNRYQFIKFALMQLEMVDHDQLARVEKEWEMLTPGRSAGDRREGKVRIDARDFKLQMQKDIDAGQTA